MIWTHPLPPPLTLDPVEEAAPAEEKKPEPAPAPEEVKLTAEEKAMVDAFAQKIDITNSQQVLQYGSACQKKIGDFSEAAPFPRWPPRIWAKWAI